MFVLSKPDKCLSFHQYDTNSDNHGKNSYKDYKQNIYIGLDTHLKAGQTHHKKYLKVRFLSLFSNLKNLKFA